MNPALSVVIFTTIAGAAQGLVATLALAALAGMSFASGFEATALVLAFVMLVIGLGSSFLHLGRPERAWRAAMMWRTSWLSREVIVLPAFIAIVALWWLGLRYGAAHAVVATWLPLLALVGAASLWYCTSMIYACLRFIEEWAHGYTLVNFVLTGLASGLVLASALTAGFGEEAMLRAAGPCALVVTLAGWLTRTLALRRNAALRHRSDLTSATGIRTPHLVQKSMGMSAGAFNTREFFHGRTAAVVKQVKLAAIGFGFAVPALLVLLALATGGAWAWWLAVPVQAAGLLADRWYFFAQARHPQNLYYQMVS